MSLRTIKKAIATSIVSLFIYTTLTPMPHYVHLYMFNQKFHNTSIPVKSKHTVAYNVDSKYTEKVYLRVRNEIGVTYINDVVRIVNVAQKSTTSGSIGLIGKDEILGLYIDNIIYYDGTEITLEHELAHFFYEKMRDKDRSEMFAQAIEKFYVIVDVITEKMKV